MLEAGFRNVLFFLWDYVKAFVLLVTISVLTLAIYDKLELITRINAQSYVILLVSPFLYAFCKYGLKELLVPDVPKSLLENPTGESAIKAVLEVLRRRARRLRLVSILLLAGLFLLVVTGIRVFISAEQSAQMATPRAIAARRLEDLLRERDQFVLTNTATGTIETTNKLRTLDRLIEVYDLKAAAIMKDDTIAISSTVSTVTTKVGSVLLLIFMSKIVVELYRYTIRLAAFYDSCADGIQASPTDKPGEIQRYMYVFSSEQVQLSGAPDTPLETGLRQVKPIVEEVSKLLK